LQYLEVLQESANEIWSENENVHVFFEERERENSFLNYFEESENESVPFHYQQGDHS